MYKPVYYHYLLIKIGRCSASLDFNCYWMEQPCEMRVVAF